MPNVTIEYADALAPEMDPELLCQSSFQACDESGLFQTHDIKVRAIPYSHYSVGGEKASFVHTTVKIIEGRTPEQKKSLSNAIYKELNRLTPEASTLTVEIVDIDKSCYNKRVL